MLANCEASVTFVCLSLTWAKWVNENRWKETRFSVIETGDEDEEDEDEVDEEDEDEDEDEDGVEEEDEDEEDE